jgi:signal transduction histidine kinase
VNVAIRLALQRDADGTPVRILGINNDITKRREAEMALEQIRQDQLRFKDDFLSHVSHELRSPLTAIKQFTTILLSGLAGALSDEQRGYQQIVLKNVGQLQSMIDDLLEVTRLETGKLTIEPERASVANAVADVFNTLQGTARARSVALSCDLPPDLPPAFADPTRLRQALIILLENAIKFTPDGGAAGIQARLDPDPRFLRLEVSDTGCGISPERTGRIFERLYQESEPTQASRKGLGLGLYICSELVTRQGGHLWVTSEPLQGSTFSFTLPVFSPNHAIAPLDEPVNVSSDPRGQPA